MVRVNVSNISHLEFYNSIKVNPLTFIQGLERKYFYIKLKFFGGVNKYD